MTLPAHHLAVSGIVLLLAMNAPAAEKAIFDFQTTTNSTAWQVVNDDVMGGVSTGKWDVTNGLAVFRGEVSLEPSGGFASVWCICGWASCWPATAAH